MRKLLILLLSLFILGSCTVQRYSYNNVIVYGKDNTPKAYYHMVTVINHIEQGDSLAIATFRDQGGRVVTVSGSDVVIETIVLERSVNHSRYYYYESRPYHLYPYRYHRGGWYHNRPSHRPHPGHRR